MNSKINYTKLYVTLRKVKLMFSVNMDRNLHLIYGLDSRQAFKVLQMQT